MQNTISGKDWLGVIDKEYLSSFVQDGGASIKVAIVPEELKDDLYTQIEARCRALDYLFVKLDAGIERAHMPQDFFFSLARQVDWRRMARQMIMRMAAQQGYQIGDIDPGAACNVLDAIAKANDLDSQFVLREIRPRIQDDVYRDTNMAKDFRVCMSHLCLQENTRGEYTGQPLLDYLTGRNTRIGGVRPYSIYTGINRTTARYFIESTFYWIRRVGYVGTVILFDNSRVTVAHNPKDGLRYYTRAMAMEHYELLREFIDGVDRLAGALLVVVANHAFLDDGANRGSRGYGIYPALRTRVMNDVRDRDRVNPVASLVRLS